MLPPKRNGPLTCGPGGTAHGARMPEFLPFAVGALLALAGLAYALRRYVCFRRRDCCGKGCGCLFPKSR